MKERKRRLAVVGLVAALVAVAAIGGWALLAQQGPDGEIDPIGPSPGTESPGTIAAYEVEIYQGRSDGDERGRCDRVFPVTRVSRGPSPLQVALEELLAGPTPDEEDDGYTSWFSQQTAGTLRSADAEAGVAHVDFFDFSRTIPGASTSCGSAALLAQLDRTVEQFPEVLRAVYSFEGDVEAFYHWLQLAPPEEPSCSAAGGALELQTEPELPEAVRELRLEIARQAVTCDYVDLERLATDFEEDDDFTFSFGDGESAASFWQRQEEEGDRPMRFLAGLLARPYGQLDDGTYVWPSAFAYDDWDAVPEDDREALRPLYGSDDFEGFAEFGAYIGYRIGITPEGDWIFFVAGD